MATVYFIPHGGGPCLFMDWTTGSADELASTRDWLPICAAGPQWGGRCLAAW